MKKTKKIVYKTSEGYRNRIEANKLILWFLFAFISMLVAILTKLLTDDKINTPSTYLPMVSIVFIFLWLGFKILEFTLEPIREYDNLKYEEMKKDK